LYVLERFETRRTRPARKPRRCEWRRPRSAAVSRRSRRRSGSPWARRCGAGACCFAASWPGGTGR